MSQAQRSGAEGPALLTPSEVANLTPAQMAEYKHPPHIDGTKAILVGSGNFGMKLAREAYRMNALAAIVDPNDAALSKTIAYLEKPKDVQKFRMIEEALSVLDKGPVIIATPPTTHFAVAMTAVNARRDVWVEKPLCVSVSDAQKLVEAAKKNDVVLFVDHLMQYNLAHEKLIRLVQAGWVGEVTRVRAARLNFGTVRVAENALWSICPHDVSLVLAVCGGRKPTTVSCVGQSVVSTGVEDYVDLHLEFAGGVRASVEASWLHFEKDRRLTVYGSSGCIIVNEAAPDKTTPELQGFKWSAKRRADGSSVAIEKSEQDMMGYLSGSSTATSANAGMPTGSQAAGTVADGGNAPQNGVAAGPGPIGNTEDVTRTPIRSALQHFLTCCKTRAKPRTDGTEGLNVLKVLVAAQESLQRKRPVLLNGTEKKKKEATSSYFKHPTAVVDSGADIGENTRIWHFSHIMSGAKLGRDCNIGQNVYVGGKAVLGKNVKVQNGVSIYDGVTISDSAFLGPHCVFTNVKSPRSHINRRNEYMSTWVGRGVTIGANATIMCGISLGEYCLVGAGSVVTRNVPAHALVYGNPASIQGWVSTMGTNLVTVARIGNGRQVLQCPDSKEVYNLFPAPKTGADPHVVREIGEDDS